MNRTYELLYIVEGTLSDEQKEKTIGRVQSILEKAKCEVVAVDKWGMKKFAYPINYKTEGYYCLVNFKAPESAIDEIKKTLNITEGVVRQMIVKKN